jgi:hypothetical protein
MTSASTDTAPVLPRAGWRGVAFPAVVAASAVGVLGLLAAVDPNEPGHYPTCPFLALTGHWCPGCGSLRALHAIAHGDLGTAMARNPFTVLSAAGLTVVWLLWVRRSWFGRARSWVAPSWLLYTLLVGVLAYWVLRNVPGWTWLSPA